LEIVAISKEGAYLMISMGSFNMMVVDSLSIEQFSTLPASVLIAGQGEKGVISEDLVNGTNPQLVILSIGAGDSKARPDAEMIDLFENLMVLRTDVNGWIVVSTDGEHMWVNVENKTE